MLAITVVTASPLQAQGRGGRGSGRFDDRAGSRDRKTASPATAKLPEQYRKFDKDGDGQIGLYEWPRSASEYAEFKKLDLNVSRSCCSPDRWMAIGWRCRMRWPPAYWLGSAVH